MVVAARSSQGKVVKPSLPPSRPQHARDPCQRLGLVRHPVKDRRHGHVVEAAVSKCAQILGVADVEADARYTLAGERDPFRQWIDADHLATRGPTRSAIHAASRPVPQPTSSTLAPACKPIRSTMPLPDRNWVSLSRS